MQKVSHGNCRLSTKRIANSRQRRIGIAAALALLPISGMISRSAQGAADTTSTLTSPNTALDVAGSWSNGEPTSTVDALIVPAYPTTPTTLTLSASETFGSLDDTNTNALTITSPTGSTLTLGGANTNSVAPATADELYIASGGNLTFSTSAGALGVALGNTNGNFDVAGAGTIDAVISASSTQGFSKTGAGSLTLSAANTYIGTTAVNAGTLILSGTIGTVAGSAATASGALSLGGGTLSYTDATDTQSFTGNTQITSGGSAIRAATGTTIALGTLTRSTGGTTDFNPAGTGAIDMSYSTNPNTAGNGIIGGWATYGGMANWAVAPASTGGAITGLATYYTTTTGGTTATNYTSTENVDVTSSPTFIAPITGANTFRFNTGTADTVTLSGTNVVTTGGILVTPTATLGGTITGGTIESATNEMIFNFGAGAGTLTLGSVLANDGSTATNVTVSGPGVLSFAALPTYTGGIFIENGATVDINAGPAADSAVFGGSITVNNGSIRNESSTNTFAQAITVNSGGLTFNQAANKAFTVASVISGVGGVNISTGGTAGITLNGNNTFTGGLTFGGTAAGFGTFSGNNNFATGGITVNLGTLTLSGANTYTGATSIASGAALIDSSAGGLGSASVFTQRATVASGGVLQLSASPSSAFPLTLTGSGVAATGFGALESTANNNTYRGQITLAGATTIGDDSGTLTLSTTPIVGGGYALTLTSQLGGTGVISSALNTSIGSVTTAVPSSKANTGYVDGVWVLSGTNTYAGAYTINPGTTLEFGNEAALYNDNTVNSGTAGAWTTSNVVVPAGATMGFAVGTNVTTGNGGTFTPTDLAILTALGTTTGGFENGSFLGIDTTGAPAGYTYTVNSGVIANTNSGNNVVGLAKLGTNSLILTAAQSYTGATQILGGTLQLGTGASGANGSLASPSILDSATLLIEPYTGTTIATNANIGGSGAVTVTGTTTGIASLGGTNTFTGATSVTAGVLDLTNSLALQNSAVGFTAATGAITFDSAVTSNAFTFGGLTANANNNYVLQNTASQAITLTIGNPQTNASSATSGVLSGPGNLTVAGFSNTLQIASASTYTGTTTITGATLNLGNAGANGSIGTTAAGVTTGGALVLGGVDSGGVLAYTRTGTVSQAFSGTTINPGESSITTSTATQTLNLGALSGNAGGTVDINPNTTSTITTATSNTNGIIGGYATFAGKTTWAVAPATTGATITGLPTASYSKYSTSANTFAPGSTANVDILTSNTPAAVTQTVNSLRFNLAAAETLTLAGTGATGGLLTVGSGGILVTPTSATNNQITGGAITGSAGGQLAIISGASSGTFFLSSLIVDNGAPTAVTISAPVGGTFNISNGSNSYSGGTFFNGGKTPTTTSAAGTPFGTGTLTLGNQEAGNVAAGGISFGGGITAFGLLASALGVNSDNGNIGTNGGNATLTMVGAPNQTALFNATFGTEAGGRQQSVALDGGTEIFGLPTNGGNFNGIATFLVNGGTLQFGDGYSGTVQNDTSNGTSVTLGGGTFVELGNVAGFYSQTYTAGLKVNAGASTVTVNSNGGAGTVFSPGAITHNAGGTVNFILPTAQGGAQTATNGITTTTLNTNGIIGGFATVGGTDWATNATNAAGGNIIGLSASTINAYSTDTYGTTLNTDVVTGGSGASTNSLRFNTAAANTVTFTGTNTITSGGILVTSNVGANLTDITGGTLEGAASADLVVIQNNTSGGLTIDSTIADNTGATALTKSGPGLLTLTGPNTYTGKLFLNGGILNAATTNIDGSSTTNNITFNGGTLQAATGGITTGKAVVIGATGGTVDTNSNAVTLSGVVSGTPSAGAGALGGFNSTGAFAFTKAGAGVLTLSNIANTFGGGLVINNGTVADTSASGTGAFGTGYVTFGTSNSPTMRLGSHNVTVAGLIGSGANGVVTGGVAGTPVLTLDGVSTQTFGGVISNGTATSVGLTVALNNPTESQILSGANIYSGTTTITTGVLTAGANSALSATSPVVLSSTANASAALNAGTFSNTIASLAGGSATGGNVIIGSAGVLAVGGTSINTNYAGTISGAGAFTMAGTGTQTLANSNAYAGGTTVTSGTLTGTVAGAFGGGNILVNPTRNATLNTNGSIAPTAAVTVNTNSPTAIGTINFNGSTPTIGNLAGSGNVVLNGSAGTTLTTGNATPTTFSGVISETLTGGGALTVAGAGTFTLTGSNMYTGTTTINGGATLALGDGMGHDGYISTTNFVTNNGSLVYNLQTPRTSAYSIGGTGSVTLNGSQTLTLANNSGFSGGTTINGGTLSLTGSLTGTGAVGVNNTGNLQGNSSVAGPVTVASTASITGGLGAANATLTVASAAIYGAANFAINSDTPSTDQLISTGAMVLGGSSVLNVTDLGSTPSTSPTFVLIDAQGGLTGTFAITNLPTNNGDAYTVAYVSDGSANGIDVDLVAAPEPASLGLLSLGGLMMMRRRRKTTVTTKA
jgi:fibronectin-binding autotransporter adhesin